MNITSKGRYALKVMLDLALLSDEGRQKRHAIAQRQGIPPDYIDHILARLRDGGLVESTRGRMGGFSLGRDPKDVSAWDILSAVEDTIYPVKCQDDEGCGYQNSCISKVIWDDIFSLIEAQLRSKSLHEMVSKLDPRGEWPTFEMPVASPLQECRAPKRA